LDEIGLGNDLISLLFSIRDERPYLASIKDLETGETFRFDGGEEFLLTTCRPEEMKSEEPSLGKTPSSALRFQGWERKDLPQKGMLRGLFEGDGLSVTVRYELGVGDFFVRKWLEVANGGGDLCLAGIAPVCLPADEARGDRLGGLGFPSYFMGGRGGFFFAAEFPTCHNLADGSRVVSEYRPARVLKRGGRLVSEAGVLAVFHPATEGACHEAFHEYLYRIAGPRLPYPVYFCDWGPWLSFASEGDCLRTIPLCREAGIDIYMIDGAWKGWDKYAEALLNPEASEPEWEDIPRRPNFPRGLQPVFEACERNGLRLGLHYDCTRSHYGEIPDYPGRDERYLEHEMAVRLVPERPEEVRGRGRNRECFATHYGDNLRRLILYQAERYNLGLIKLDFYVIADCLGKGHHHFSNGYDSTDQQALKQIRLIEEARRVRPDLYVYGYGHSPYWVRYVHHLHTRDPNIHGRMPPNHGFGVDYKYRTLAAERRASWYERYWDRWTPSWAIKMDIGGYAFQQRTLVPLFPESTDYVVSQGVGWKQTLFSALATSLVRDFRLNLLFTSREDREFMRRWLQWGRENAEYLSRTKVFLSPPDWESLEGYSHLRDNRGFIFVFNPSFQVKELTLVFDETIGFRRGGGRVTLRMLHPAEAAISEPKASWSYGEAVRLPVPPKDCLILEVAPAGKKPPVDPEREKAEYRRFLEDVGRLDRSYQPLIYLDYEALETAFLEDPPTILCAEGSPREELMLKALQRTVNLVSGSACPVKRRPGPRDLEGNIVVMAHRGTRRILSEVGFDRFVEGYHDVFVQTPDGRLSSACVVETLRSPRAPGKLVLLVLAPELEQLFQGISHLKELFLSRHSYSEWRDLAQEDFEAGYCPRGGREVSVSGGLPPDSEAARETGALFYLNEEGELVAAPPQRRGTGYSFGSWSVRLPEGGRALLSLRPVAVADLEVFTDGVGLKVLVSAEGRRDVLMDEVVVPLIGVDQCPHSAMETDRLIDLTPYRGREVSIRLVADAGPNDHGEGDLVHWGHPKILRAKAG